MRLFVLAAAQPTFDFGVRAGATFSQLSADYAFEDGSALASDTDSERGFEVAAIADLMLSDRFGLVAEAGYVRRSYSQSFPFQVGDTPQAPTRRITLTSRFSTVTTAVLGRACLFRGAAAPYVVAGPRLDVLVGREAGAAMFGTPVSTLFAEDLYPDLFADVNLGAVGGVGLEVRRASWPALRAEARYGRSVTDFFSTGGPAQGTLSGLDVSVAVLW